MEKQDLRVYRASLVLWGRQVTRVSLESLAKRGCQALLENLDQEEIQGKMAWMVLQESKVNRVPLVIEDHLGHLVQEDSRVCLVHLEKQDSLEKMEMQAFLVQLACKATKENKAQEVFLDKGVPLVPQVQQE